MYKFVLSFRWTTLDDSHGQAMKNVENERRNRLPQQITPSFTKSGYTLYIYNILSLLSLCVYTYNYIYKYIYIYTYMYTMLALDTVQKKRIFSCMCIL